jgi:predicted dehydrogenase
MKDKINLGIIGKNFGYKVIYNAIKDDKSFNVLGFAFKKKNKVKELPEGIKIYQNWKKLILDKKIDSIVISSPPLTHLKIINFAIKNNKNIFCEKPVTTSLNDILKISELAKNKKIVFMVNYEFLNIDAFKIFKKEYLKDIKVKKVNIDWLLNVSQSKRSSWKNTHLNGGGNFFNYICHVLFYLEKLFGKLTIYKSKILNSKGELNYDFIFFIKKKKIKVLFNFKISNNQKSKPFHRLKIFSNKGNYMLKTNITNLYDQFYLKKDNKILFKPDEITHDFRIKPTYDNLKKFKSNVLKKRSSSPNLQDAKRIHLLVKNLNLLSKNQ